MRNTLSFVAAVVVGAAVVVLLTASLAGCGGKILEDPNARAGSSDGASGASGTSGASSGGFFETPPPATPSQPDPPSTKGTVEDPCAAMCERDGKCGAWQPDCYERCSDDMRAR